MKQTKTGHWLAAAAFATALAVGGAVQAYETTNTYKSDSLSQDINKSCFGLQTDPSDEESLQYRCNFQRANGEISWRGPLSINLFDEMECGWAWVGQYTGAFYVLTQFQPPQYDLIEEEGTLDSMTARVSSDGKEYRLRTWCEIENPLTGNTQTMKADNDEWLRLYLKNVDGYLQRK